jgi:Mg-chelatase subunit ChlD
LANRLILTALALLVVAAVGYNVWSWRTESTVPPASNSTAAATPIVDPASSTTTAVPAETALAPPAPAAAPLAATSVSWDGDGGSIEAQLSLRVDEQHRPTTPAVEFDENAPEIFISLKSTLPRNERVGIYWRRLAGDTLPAADVGDTTALVPAGEIASAKITPGRTGFLPGDYEVSISIGNINPKTLPFRITSTFAAARQVVTSEGLPGMNVAVAALGGRVASASAGSKSTQWRADNLIDGFPFLSGGSGCVICGWTSSGDTAPFALVFALAGDKPVTIDSVVLDPTTEDTTKGQWNLIPRNVRISVSTTSAGEGFTQVATARLAPRAIEQLVAVPPTAARFVKLEILNNWGGNSTQLGEVRVLEQPGVSALEQWPRNIALPAVGGVVARFSSQDGIETGAQRLIDDALDDPWVSSDRYLPQDLVFAFKDDQLAKIDRVVLRPHGRAPESWPKTVLISVSSDSFFDFADVGQFELAKEDRDFEFPVKRDARFLRVRILANHGGRETSLNEVRIFEGSAPGYVSVLARTAPLASPSAAVAAAAVKAEVEEQETNNDTGSANAMAIGRSMGGTIEPLGESDVFAVEVPGAGRQVLSLQVAGSPFIKTSVSLLDAAGKPARRFDPAHARGTAANVSWLVDPGKQFLQVSEPPASIVLIWDTSSSMEGMTDALREAVLAYLSQVRPTEQLNMIRFSDEVEVLLKQFSSDPDLLRAAASSDKFYPFGGTRFYDAVQQGIDLLSSATGNRAIIVLSDGEDSLSKMEAPRFWDMLQREGVRLYTIGLGVALKGFATRIGSTGQRFMAHSSYVTNGRSFFARDSTELKALYDRIASELRAVSRYRITPTMSAAPGKLTIAATGERIASVAAPARVQLVLDASGSMNRRIGNKRMIDAAKDVLTAVVKGLPDEVQVGLRVYGHRIKEGQRGDCEDSQQVQPIGKLDRTRLLNRIHAINALGTTPIAYSLNQVGKDLAGAAGQQMVILVTDGREECGGDPKAAVAALKAQGLNVRVNIVGFALTDTTAQQQLADAAALTGGSYVTAKDDTALKAALDQAMRVPFDVLDSSGASVASGQVGDAAVSLPEGHYTVVVRAADRPITISDVRIVANQDSRIELKKEGSAVGVKVTHP